MLWEINKEDISSNLEFRYSSKYLYPEARGLIRALQTEWLDIFFDKRDRSLIARIAIILKFKLPH